MTSVRPTPTVRRGRVITLPHRSACLAGNPWEDPVERELTVYLPPGAEPDAGAYPVICYLAAYTGSGRAFANWRAFGENLGERLDRLIAAGRLGPVIVVAPDCFTSLGGNQYLDSPGLGAYERYVHEELMPFAERELPILPGARHRAVLGKSSGGYGALGFGMRRPGFWNALACQSADCHFEVTVRPDFPTVADRLARHEGDPLAFLRWFWRQPAPGGADIHTLMFLCLAASYDPQDDGGIALPFALATLELDPVRWERWLRHDPIAGIAQHAEALAGLGALYLDCGNRDQYNIHYGMRILSRELERHGIGHRYEEFDGTHSGIDWRLDHSLPALYEVIAP